jgi:hypothetical protein
VLPAAVSVRDARRAVPARHGCGSSLMQRRARGAVRRQSTRSSRISTTGGPPSMCSVSQGLYQPQTRTAKTHTHAKR